MKILFLVNAWPSEKNPIDGIYHKDQVEALIKKNLEIDVVLLRIKSLKDIFKRKFKSNSTQHFGGYNLHIIERYNIIPKLRYGPLLLAQYYFYFIQYFKKNLCTEEYDIVHAHNLIYMGLIAARFKKNYKNYIGIIVTEHSTAYSRKLVTKSQLQLIINYACHIKYILPVGFGLKKILANYFDSNKIIQVNNVIDIDRFRPKLNKISTKITPFIFLSIGTITTVKGFDILIRAFSKLTNRNTRLIIGGIGPMKEEIQKLISELKLEDRVKLIGLINNLDVPRYMAESNAFILVSRHETFGIVFAEAIASGIPVIASKTGGPDHFIDKDVGILVNVNDIEGTTIAMEKIIHNYNNYDKAKIRNKAYQFSEKAFSTKIIKIYKNALESILIK